MGSASVGNVENSTINPKKKQKEIRSLQLQKVLKPSFLLSKILDQCCNLKPDKINIFFQLLNEHLNEISRRVFPTLYERYKMQLKESDLIATENDSKQQEAKNSLTEIEDCITRSSLGIEHIFRELGQVYEAYRLCDERFMKFQLSTKLKYDPCLLSVVVARLILHSSLSPFVRDCQWR